MFSDDSADHPKRVSKSLSAVDDDEDDNSDNGLDGFKSPFFGSKP